MDIFDSSVWLWGLLTDARKPNRLLQDVLDGDRHVAVSAYIHDEVTNALNSAREVTDKTDDEIAEAQMTFNNTVADLDNVVFPDQEKIGQTFAADIRSQPSMRLLGTILDIQAKDAPVLVFAFDVSDDSTLYVADSGFDITPGEYNINSISLESVPV